MTQQFDILKEINEAVTNNASTKAVDIGAYKKLFLALVTDAMENKNCKFLRLGNIIDSPNVLVGDLFPSVLYVTEANMTAFFGEKQDIFLFSERANFKSRNPAKRMEASLNPNVQANFSIVALFIKYSFEQTFCQQEPGLEVSKFKAALNVEINKT